MKPGIAIPLGVAGILAAIGTAIANANGMFAGHPSSAYWFWGASFGLIIVAIAGWIFNSQREKKKRVDPLSLQHRTLALAQRLRQFIQKHGPRPTLVKADGESNADYLKRLIPKTQAWDDTVSGDYWGFLFGEIQQIRGELAQKKGMADSRIDDNYRIQRPKEENLRAIVEGLRFLASKLHD